ncbi:hypothetical protein [Dongia deserti]|uniref:hypothetical protein n=1 Tax=Dongia deserti TaxID=2268030 RepID=UPI000E65823B|nr:hypothetical protein [Dongia deserti]
MTQVWDVSVLVDGVGRILEVRGQANLHLGQDGKGLIGQSIINFVDDSDVEHFQGFFKKLRPVIAAPRCVVHLKTPAFGIRSYVMQAEPGNQLETYWLMFAAAGPGMSATAIKDAQLPATFADDSRMLRLIEMAASESDSTLDLTVIAIAALRDRRKRGQLQGKNIELLEAELEQAILDVSKEGTASKTGAGEFSVLHSHQQSVHEIESNLRDVAGRFGVGKEELGFHATTVKIEAGSTPSAIREKIAFAYNSVREDLDEFDSTATPVDMMKVLAFCVVALAIGGIVGAVLAYMP